MAGPLLDAMVMAYAVTDSADPKFSAQRKQWSKDSASLIRSLSPPRTSAIAWAEFLRLKVPPDAAEELSRLVRIESLDRRVAKLAGQLLGQYRSQPGVCRECLSWVDHHPCKVCKNRVSNVHRMNDLLLIAHAQVLSVPVYTYDRGVLAMAKHVGIPILMPENADGPLFARKAEQPRVDESASNAPTNVVSLEHKRQARDKPRS